MKTRNIVLKSLCMATFLFVNIQCQNQEDNFIAPEAIDTSQLTNFKGLQVNHRFATPTEHLESNHSLEALQNLYQSLQQRASKTKGTASRTTDTTLPNAEVIVEAAREVIDEFPYGIIPEDVHQEIDSVTLAQKAEQNWEMIKADFPTLTEAEIEENMPTIEAYYEQNLDYVVLNEIAENETTYADRVASKTTYVASLGRGDFDCIANLSTMVIELTTNPLNIIKVPIAIALATDKSSVAAGNYYGVYGSSFLGISYGGGGESTRGDAYRHVLWSALLADYYFTISAKAPRLEFAKLVADTYESCTGGDADSKEMDYHNNAIGRKIWDDNTYYRTLFGWNIGLNTPSLGRLKSLVKHAVNRNSTFIVKKDPNSIINNYSTQEIYEKIVATHSDRVVYFLGTIAPFWYEWEEVATGYDYTPCYTGDYANCPTITYETVRIKKFPRFISKDPNLNPELLLND